MARKKNEKDLYQGTLFDLFVEEMEEEENKQSGDKEITDWEGFQLEAPTAKTATSHQNPTSSPQVKRRLSEHQCQVIMQELRNGESSARALSEMLINKHGAANNRFVTDKPHIYVDVCLYLDQLCNEGICELQSKEPNDRVYVTLKP